ncbi:hypothetical protein BMS3Bbin02_01546 [bacterium BMS3Bbin02]|nr:hypothetical protein BMS3Bbin02_01546 [bacterium BMS3Bbin02]
MSVEVAATIQAVSTVVLVAVTIAYVMLTNRLAKTAKQSLELAVLPRLIIERGACGEEQWRVPRSRSDP